MMIIKGCLLTHPKLGHFCILLIVVVYVADHAHAIKHFYFQMQVKPSQVKQQVIQHFVRYKNDLSPNIL